MEDRKVYCGICEVEIIEEINFKSYAYVHKRTEEAWCDQCVAENEY